MYFAFKTCSPSNIGRDKKAFFIEFKKLYVLETKCSLVIAGIDATFTNKRMEIFKTLFQLYSTRKHSEWFSLEISLKNRQKKTKTKKHTYILGDMKFVKFPYLSNCNFSLNHPAKPGSLCLFKTR